MLDMKFRLVEDLNLELKQFFGNSKYQTSNPSGSKYINSKVAEKLGLRTPAAQDYYIVHHINGNHNDTHEDNVILILNSEHSKLHSSIMKRIESDDRFTDDTTRYMLGFIAKVQKLDTLVSSLKDYVGEHDIGIQPEDIVLDLPRVSQTSNNFEAEKEKLFKDEFNQMFGNRDKVLIKVPFKKNRKEIYTFSNYFRDDKALRRNVVA